MTELKLCIDEKFYEEEERDGYVVDKKAKQIWAVELDLLNELLNVCKKYEIEVYAFAGTLLGAVRHKGFIPWDDDVDVCMTRENFERLLNIADKEFQYPYFLQTALNDRKFFLGYARLRNSETTGVIQWNRSPEYNNGIYIDIFVLDGYIESKIKYKVQMVRKEIIGFILRTYYSKTMPKPFLKKAVFLLACRIFPKMIPYEWAVKRYNFILSLYSNQAGRLSILTHSNEMHKKYYCMKEDLSEVKWVPFEMLQIPIPAKYDRMLHNMYGNYMEFPPIEKRGVWHQGIIYFDPTISYKEYFTKIDKE